MYSVWGQEMQTTACGMGKQQGPAIHQYPSVNHGGREYKKELHMCMAVYLLCSTILEITILQKKKFFKVE